ncbi:DUF4132 domain-containing protein [Glycomyces algeriensis]|uniref:DUF4132 domain-containing protein n=1 Tax=Glycomyces algeriensis TaxID=256037 RepID=A0A9W6GDK7_9ACTN|nr:DUF4132 domain-containing protein [Glycomyces algeriensis]MDA1367829.1 DUF4132 domain-containing protein [Glycomyces algeriensis]MDR7351975.1 hypothetical protein [Glycomyces algeriensis]GLI44708.1 hypothetical protein GALLR39Z86_45580 [Glycomyces algeriensis]
MTEPVAMQEEQLRLPVDWAEWLLPRRGSGAGIPVEPDAAASRKVAAAVDARRDDLIASLERPECDPDLSRAGLAHLGGAPNPTGAAAVLTMLRFIEPYRASLFQPGGERALANRELFAAVVADFGLPFAVSTGIEDLVIGFRWAATGSAGPADVPAVVVDDASNLKWRVWADREGVLPFVRALIAAADDAEYRRIVDLAAQYRATPLKRVAAALLLPGEREWVAAACEARDAYRGDPAVEELVWAIVSDEDHLRLLGVPRLAADMVRHRLVPELVRNLGVAALPVLAKTLDQKSLDLAQRTLLFQAIALLPDDAAADLLVERAAEPGALAAVKPAAARFPHRFARAVAARAADTAPADRVRLAGALRQEGVPLESVLKGLNDTARAAVEALLAETAPLVAASDRLPAVLLTPSWAERRRRRAPEPVPGLTAPAGVELRWGPGELDAALALEPAFAEWDEAEFWVSDSVTGLGLAERLLGRLARGGDPGAVIEKLRDSPKHGSALVPIRSAEAAALAADWFARLKSARVHAADWLDRHGEHAVPHLVPCALGADKRLRDGGEAALRYLARRLGDQPVLDAAASFGPDALARITGLLATDPRVPLAGTVNPGDWADPDMLPPVMLRGKETALPAVSVRHLIGALALWSPRLQFPGVDDFAAHCDPVSLQRFSLALFDLWLRSEAPSKDSWAVDQLGAFGNDDTVAVLGPLVAQWPGRSQNERAHTGLEVLAHIGTDAAFTALRDISRAFKFPNSTTERARGLADRLAAARGLTFEGLADRLTPDHGAAETVSFDYGPRRFHLTFDRLLTPHLTDDAGKPRKALPKPGVRDDAASAKAAVARYKALVKSVGDTAETQVELLCAAMLDGRVFTLDDLRVLDAHPISGVFTRRLAWFSRGAGFRIAEDGGFADVDDREFRPDPDAIRLAHPALLRDETPAWTALFADYELLQPFDQLARPRLHFTEEELETGRLPRFDGLRCGYADLGARIGWTQTFLAPGPDLSWVWRLQQRLPGGWLLADADPEPDRHNPDPDGVHTVTALRLQANRNRRPEHARPLPGRAIDPVAASELLARLTGVQTTS